MDTYIGNAPPPLFQDDAEQGIFRFSPKVYSDPDLFECEQRRIFDRARLYAAHESEVPQAGDFLKGDLVP
jgi:benzoate/toluate 1,2-dioxygenase subunit alpha